MQTYEVVFDRIEGWAECNGIRATATRSKEAIVPLVRAMIDAGLEDGALRCIDERGMHCFTIRSFRGYIKTPGTSVSADKPSEPKPVIKKPLVSEEELRVLTDLGSGRRASWMALHGRTKQRFKHNGWVDDGGFITHEGRTVLARESLQDS